MTLKELDDVSELAHRINILLRVAFHQMEDFQPDQNPHPHLLDLQNGILDMAFDFSNQLDAALMLMQFDPKAA